MVVIKNVVLRIADSQQILEFQKLLFRIYCLELEWHPKENFSNGVFTDEYDDVSVFLTIHDDEKLLGGVRVVFDSEKKFPHEDVSMLSLPDIDNNRVNLKIRNILKEAGRDRIAEVTRFISEKTSKRIYTYDLMKALYWFGIRNNILVYFMVVDLKMFISCYRLGFILEPVGVTFFCEGSWVIPSVMVVKDMILLPENERAYFLSKANVVGEWKLNI